MPENTSNLEELLSKNLPFHIVIESEVEATKYGQITFTVELRGGVVALETLNIVKNRRKRYRVDKEKK